jgi:hypothetical protein
MQIAKRKLQIAAGRSGRGKLTRWQSLVAGSLTLLLAATPVIAQDRSQDLAWGRKKCQPPVCPTPEVEKPPVEPGKEPRPPETPPTPQPELAPERAVALGSEETVALAAPNMIGNLLGAGRSVSFFINRTQGAVFINGLGSTNISNPKVAENNSPLPEDRAYFRYNFFSQALSVVGVSSAPPVFDPTLGAFRQGTTVKNYDVNSYTFGFEKTFFHRALSVEVRIPFSQTLSSDLNLSSGTVIGTSADSVDTDNNPLPGIPSLRIVETPQATLGNERTEFGNMTVILKALIIGTPKIALSTGLSIGLPTGDDTHVRVTDFLGRSNANSVDLERVRDFQVGNETVSISPFLALLAIPTERFFAQGFFQFDFPVNTSPVTYTETVPLNVGEPFVATTPGTLTPPFTVNSSIREQTLVQLDLGTGYWLFRNPEGHRLTGIAPTVEMHYTTTLSNANIVTLPRDPSIIVTPNALLTPPAPTVGNRNNRLDILDLTIGSTFEFARRFTLATGFSLPMKGQDNRTFDWEFQLQLNYYFGGPSQPPVEAPTFTGS